jgi:NAD+ kinase
MAQSCHFQCPNNPVYQGISPPQYLSRQIVNLKNILIVYKKSTYQIQALDHKEPHFLQLLEAGNEAVSRVKVSHQEHYRMVEQIEQELSKLNLNYQSVVRGALPNHIRPEEADLVISVGGDGTFLDVSHHVLSTPVLGVNSATSSSFGHYCLCNENNLAPTLSAIISGQLEPKRLLRLEVSINGLVLPELILNEVLLCHPNPAGTSRYFIEIGDIKEEHRSSGLWIGPPSGSTGALRAAGAEVLPIVSPSRKYQYVVREPWSRPGQKWSLLKGQVDENIEIHVLSGMRLGCLYIDGPHIRRRFNLGDEIAVRVSKNDLMAFVNPKINDVFSEENN